MPHLLEALERTAGGDEVRAEFFRWYALRLRRFETFSARNLHVYQRLRIPALIAAVAVPAIVAWDLGHAGRFAATALSAFVAAATVLEEFLGAGRRWRHHRATVEPLKAEGWMYVAPSDVYESFPNHGEAFSHFAGRIGRAPETRINLHWLGRQREMLGDTAFRAVLANHLSPGDVARLIDLLDSAASAEAGPIVSGSPAAD